MTLLQLPPCVEALNIDFAQENHIKKSTLCNLCQYVIKKSWKKLPSFTLLKHPSTLVYLGNNRICIDLGKVLGTGGNKKVTEWLFWDKSVKRAELVAATIFSDSVQYSNEKAIADAFPDHFVPIYAISPLANSEQQIIVMKKADSNLEALVETGQLCGRSVSYFDCLQMCIQIAEDLRKLHQKGFLHGDLAVWNALAQIQRLDQHFISGYVAHLHDFGNSHKKAEAETHLRMRKGNVLYYSPETLEFLLTKTEKRKKVDPFRGELWTLGKMFQELLCPELELPWPHLFSIEDRRAVLRNFRSCVNGSTCVQLDPRVILDKYKKPIPHDGANYLQGFVVTMLNPDPEKRPSLEQVIPTLKNMQQLFLKAPFERQLNDNTRQLTPKQLGTVLNQIIRNHWKHVPVNTRRLRGITRLPAEYIYLGGDRFCINLGKVVGRGCFKEVQYALLYNKRKNTSKLVVNACADFDDDYDEKCSERERKIATKFPNRFVKVHAVVFNSNERKQDLILSSYDVNAKQLVDNGYKINGVKLSQKELLSLALQVAKDLAYLHFKGYFHGDLDDENVLIRQCFDTKGYVAHLHDFGFTFKKDQLDSYLSYYSGAHQFWAPEIMRFHLLEGINSDSIDFAASEVWAMGKIICLLLNLKVSLPLGKDANKKLRDHIDDKRCLSPKQSRKIIESCKEAIVHEACNPLHELVVAMMQFNPGNRPSLATVIQQLRRCYDEC